MKCLNSACLASPWQPKPPFFATVECAPFSMWRRRHADVSHCGKSRL